MKLPPTRTQNVDSSALLIALYGVTFEWKKVEHTLVRCPNPTAFLHHTDTSLCHKKKNYTECRCDKGRSPGRGWH